jgi:hypothetical protein
MKTFITLCLSACLLRGGGTPALRPGEGLALAATSGDVQLHGEARTEGPLGDLACLPWLRLEGYVWSSGKFIFPCKGSLGGFACTVPKGHGRVDLRKAFECNCRLALLAWIHVSAAGWAKLEGPMMARMKVQEVFQPFLGSRMPKGEAMPAFGMEWAGEGGLLRASPESLAGWLADPAQEQAESMFRRYGAGFFEGDVGDYQGWTYVGRAGSGAEACTWVAGGQRGKAAALRMPGTPKREEALRRFRELLRAPAP